MIEKYGTVEMKDWGKDHWSMFAYIECRCVDFDGVLDYKHIRGNETFHPEIPPEQWRTFYRSYTRWLDKYSTRIKGGEQIRGHDDWDCAEDLQAAGLIKIVSMAHFQIKITDLGWVAAVLLRKHKSTGGVFSNFRCNLASIAA